MYTPNAARRPPLPADGHVGWGLLAHASPTSPSATSEVDGHGAGRRAARVVAGRGGEEEGGREVPTERSHGLAMLR